MILLLAGTGDSKKIAKELENSKENFIISVATDYGYKSFKKTFPDKIVRANFDEQSLISFIDKNKITKIIDATHPFATNITEIAENAAIKTGIKYENRKRKIIESSTYERAIFFSSKKEVFEFLRSNCKRILFTIGSKHAYLFKDFFENSVFRILPYEKSIKHLTELGLSPKNIIALEGVLSVEFNLAIIDEFKIDCIVSKNSGKEGGLDNKIEAARQRNIYILVLQPEFFKR